MRGAASISFCFAFCCATAGIPLAARAVVSQQYFVSDDGSLYYLVSSDFNGGIGSQVTSLAIGDANAISLNEAQRGEDPFVTTLSAVASGNARPLNSIMRTAKISGLPGNHIDNMGNPLTGIFDPSANGGSGLLILPGGVRTVAFDGSGTEPIVAATVSTDAGMAFVPAATMVAVDRRVAAQTVLGAAAIVFPHPAGAPIISSGSTCAGGSNSGFPCDPANGPSDTCAAGGACTNLGGPVAGQNVTLDSAVGQRVGNPASQPSEVDGFFLANTTEMIVFLVDVSGGAVGLSASGFDVTGTCGNSPSTSCAGDADCPGGVCTDALSARNVVGATGGVLLPPPLPTHTATPGPSPTPTPMPLCPPLPSSGCRSSAKSFFLLSDVADDSRHKLIWRWREGAKTDLFALGNPVTGSTDYGLCVYGTAAGVAQRIMTAVIPAASQCGGTFCWHPRGTRGVTYEDRAGDNAGITKLVLKVGESGKARITVKGRGATLPMPMPADLNNLVRQDPTVTVQLHNSERECWEAVFPAPATTVSQDRFKDRF